MTESAYFWSVSGVVKVCHFFLTATLSWGILYIMTRQNGNLDQKTIQENKTPYPKIIKT
jgi:hypothetical protein